MIKISISTAALAGVIVMVANSSHARTAIMEDHLFTISEDERDVAIHSGYKDEGVCWYALHAATVPLYRLHLPKNGDYFYTTSLSERDSAIADAGYKDEEVCCYVWAVASRGSIALYRLYNAQSGQHLYTTSVAERNRATAKLGFKDEGICCYLQAAATHESEALYSLFRATSRAHL